MGNGSAAARLSVFNAARCPSHLVIRDISFDEIGSLFMWNWLITDCDNGAMPPNGGVFGAQSQQSGEGFTGYRVDARDAARPSPIDGMQTWGKSPQAAHRDLFRQHPWSSGRNDLGYNGWADPTGAGGANTPQPPHVQPQCLQQHPNSDQTYDHVISAGRVDGLETRSGAQFVDSLMLTTILVVR